MRFLFLNMPDRIGEKPLEFAAVQGDVVKDLLKQRLQVFFSDDKRETPDLFRRRFSEVSKEKAAKYF